MTDPEATDADRQEQQQPETPPVPELADEVAPPADDVPEADGIEQQLSAVPGSAGGLRAGDPEADEYDVLEQQAAVPADEDDVRD
ncbi:hypothetical protein [Modestobacter excelsi]|uniref:hypothetical protein n=1 Tax=Modestobacter excelsi TaxID=2213161 RepID=UPI00110D00EE|nr:hypothetical protein [Modestobacter excelsi]